MSKINDLLEKMSLNSNQLNNCEEWDKFMKNTKIDIKDLTNLANELGYSTFQKLRITTNPTSLYNADSKTLLKAFNRSIDISKVNYVDMFKDIRKAKAEALTKAKEVLESLTEANNFLEITTSARELNLKHSRVSEVSLRQLLDSCADMSEDITECLLELSSSILAKSYPLFIDVKKEQMKNLNRDMKETTIVVGNTKKITDELKSLGFKFTPNVAGYWYR